MYFIGVYLDRCCAIQSVKHWKPWNIFYSVYKLWLAVRVKQHGLYIVVKCLYVYMFHRGRVGNVLSIPLYVLTCKEIDNKATLTFDFDKHECGSV